MDECSDRGGGGGGGGDAVAGPTVGMAKRIGRMRNRIEQISMGFYGSGRGKVRDGSDTECHEQSRITRKMPASTTASSRKKASTGEKSLVFILVRCPPNLPHSEFITEYEMGQAQTDYIPTARQAVV